MMSQLANAVLFPVLVKIPDKTVCLSNLCHLCSDSIIQFPSKHLRFSDDRRTNVPMFLAMNDIICRYLILYILFYNERCSLL